MPHYLPDSVLDQMRQISNQHFDSTLSIYRPNEAVLSGGQVDHTLALIASGIGCRVSSWSSQPMDEQFAQQEQASNRWLIIVDWKEERVRFKDRLEVTQSVGGITYVRKFDVMVMFRQQSYRVITPILCYEVISDV